MRGVRVQNRFPTEDVRLLELAFDGPEGWYQRHARESLVCLCGLQSPDRQCDRGEALFRLSVKEGGAR